MRAEFGGRVQKLVSRDERSVLLVAAVKRPFDRTALLASLRAVETAHPGISVEETGDVSVDSATSDNSNRDLHRAELLSLPVTLVVLLLAFGSGIAAIVPVLVALSAVLAAFGLLGPISHAFPLDSSVKTILFLIGMAVGVDYALFYVTRSREERARGREPGEALARTAATSGRTVFVAGCTVAVAMAGQYIVGLNVFNGIASGTIAVVGCTVVASLTVLPALLALLGRTLDRGHIPFMPRLLPADGRSSRFWPAVIDRVLRRPLLSLLAATALLLALAAPALHLHVSLPSDEALAPQTAPALQTLNQIRAEFPSTSRPATLVVTTPPNERAGTRRAITRLERRAAARGLVHAPFAQQRSANGLAWSIRLPLTGNGDNQASRDAVTTLRQQLIPQTLGRIEGVQALVTGDTAQNVDFTSQVKHGIPYVLAFVLALAFLLLLVTFRSIVVPLKAIALNLLSVAAAYGVLVLVFQQHWAEGLLGFHSIGSIVSWLPLFLFVVLFGLSMDYHVFILSRVREAVDEGMSSDEAVRYGITRTAGVVTSAALVMVAVFSIFGTASALDVKEAGVGLAAAILIDATIIRAVLLPASMKLLGDWNWYLPRWLDWLPRIRHEAPTRHELPIGAPAPATRSGADAYG
jgi:uncharacterized membrane protein YdfJ with MMPL/SSD domain